MADRTVSTELSRDLSLFHLTMMGLGMMIGAGVFLGIGNSIFVAGPGGVLLTFALNGLLALFTAMSYAELSSAIPRAGGAYNFARIGFGRGTSFLAPTSPLRDSRSSPRPGTRPSPRRRTCPRR